MSPTQIRNLQIDVLLRKQQEDNMSNVSSIPVSDVIKALKTVMRSKVDRTRSNTMSNDLMKAQVDNLLGPQHITKLRSEDYPIAIAKADGDLKKQLEVKLAYEDFKNEQALRMFPQSKTVYQARALYDETEIGKRVLNRGLQADYESLQKRVAQRDADIITKMNKPHAVHAQPEPEGHDDDDGGEGTIDQKVERLMQSRNISRDAAISILHCLEKAARGLTF
jgi:hypothetical protein